MIQPPYKIFNTIFLVQFGFLFFIYPFLCSSFEKESKSWEDNSSFCWWYIFRKEIPATGFCNMIKVSRDGREASFLNWRTLLILFWRRFRYFKLIRFGENPLSFLIWLFRRCSTFRFFNLPRSRSTILEILFSACENGLWWMMLMNHLNLNYTL